jgi:hypothetical protein
MTPGGAELGNSHNLLAAATHGENVRDRCEKPISWSVANRSQGAGIHTTQWDISCRRLRDPDTTTPLTKRNAIASQAVHLRVRRTQSTDTGTSDIRSGARSNPCCCQRYQGRRTTAECARGHHLMVLNRQTVTPSRLARQLPMTTNTEVDSPVSSSRARPDGVTAIAHSPGIPAVRPAWPGPNDTSPNPTVITMSSRQVHTYVRKQPHGGAPDIAPKPDTRSANPDHGPITA